MTAELLRRAAKVLRERVAELPDRLRCSWEQDSSEIYAGPTREWVGEALHEDGAEPAYYIELMHPPVALALAVVCDDMAAQAELREYYAMSSPIADEVFGHLADLARAILREDAP